MKTWEMIKELTENHDKEFISTKYEEVVYYDNFGEIIYKDNTAFVLDEDTLYDTWTEVIELVDFLTAYKDCLENGTRYEIMGQCDPIVSMTRVNGDVRIFSLLKCVILSDKWKKVTNDNN